MQSGGRRLNAVDRSTRPRRPTEWLEARALFERLPRVVADRVRALLRVFITNAANRVGYVFAELGMMLRDVLYHNAIGPLHGAQETLAQNTGTDPGRHHCLPGPEPQDGSPKHAANTVTGSPETCGERR